MKVSNTVGSPAVVESLEGRAMFSAIVSNGDIVGGYRVNFNQNDGVSVVSDGVKGNELRLEVNFAFAQPRGFNILFRAVSPTARPVVRILNDTVTNVSGTTFTGVDYFAIPVPDFFSGQKSAVQFRSAADVFTADPAETRFSTLSFSTHTVAYSGGPGIGDLMTGDFGFGRRGGDLVLVSSPLPNGFAEFALKTLPIVAQPAAASTPNSPSTTFLPAPPLGASRYLLQATQGSATPSPLHATDPLLK